MLGERQINLLGLLSQDSFQTAEQLAAKMKLSTKTIRTLIKELDQILSENGAHIRMKRGEGYLLEVEDFERFQGMFAGKGGELPNTSQERVSYLLEYFLNHSDYVKTEELCDVLYVCKKTLASDIKKVRQILKEYELTLEQKPYYGMRVKGDELHIRLCLAKCQERKNAAGKLAELSDREENGELKKVSDCVLAGLDAVEYHISDIALQNLIVHIYVAIKRIQSGQYIPWTGEEYRSWVGEREHQLARRCADRLEESFSVKFPEEEILYMAIHLAGKESRTSGEKSEENVIISNEFHEIVLEMLTEIYEVFQIDLREDLELVMALGQHLGPLSVRMRFGMKLQNPLLSEIKERFSLAYAMAIQGCAVLERHFQWKLPPSEIAYIALVLALALERQRTSREKKTVLLVCASGAGTAKLLAFRLQDMFHDCVGEVLTCDERSALKQDFSRIDYIFTTVPILETVPVPICEVNFTMRGEDITAVRKLLSSVEYRKVLEYYPRELFFTGAAFDTKEEALAYICAEIEKRRPLPKGFLQAVLRREKLAQTFMGTGAAMPHPCKVMTEDTFVAVCILDRPILWNEGQLVSVVFLVSISKRTDKQIQDFYQVTARLLLNAEYIKELAEKKTYETLETLIIRLSKEMEDR